MAPSETIQVLHSVLKVVKRSAFAHKVIMEKVTDPCWECPICYEGFQGKVMAMTPCGHVFHEECLMGSLERSRSCPYCRQEKAHFYQIQIVWYFDFLKDLAKELLEAGGWHVSCRDLSYTCQMFRSRSQDALIAFYPLVGRARWTEEPPFQMVRWTG